MVQDLEAMNNPPVYKIKNQKTPKSKNKKQPESQKRSAPDSLAPDYGEEDGEDERMDAHQTTNSPRGCAIFFIYCCLTP